MTFESIQLSLLGGILIGLAVTWMLLFNGRVTGISGILNAAFTNTKGERVWRIYFILGLIFGGLVLGRVGSGYFENFSGRPVLITILGGLLVGYGTVLGSGCTSGHGICGMARFSVRSVIATLVFMASGILTVAIYKAVTL